MTNAAKHVATWRVYGVCVGASHIFMNFDSADSFVDQSAIMGVDYYGRYSLHAAMRVYRHTYAAFGAPATGAFLGYVTRSVSLYALPSSPPRAATW
jgi:hypothetical protein